MTTITTTPLPQALAVPHGLLAPSPTNPRKRFDAAALAELAESIAEHGVLTPITARPNPEYADGNGRPPYEVVCGERRWRGCGLLLAEHRNYPGNGLVPILLRELTDAQVLALQALENVQRQDLHPLEEADHYHLMVSHPRHPATVPEVAQLIGKSTSYVQARLNLRRLGLEARQAFLDGLLDFSKALRVSAMPMAQQPSIVQHITTWGGEPMGVRAAERFMIEQHTLLLARAPWNLADPDLLPEAGACSTCPSRTDQQPGLFDVATDGDRCLDGACWARKRQAQHDWLVRNAEAEGYQVARGDRAAAMMRPDSTTPADGWHDLSARVPAHLGDATLTVEQAIDRANTPAESITVLDQPHRERLVHLVTTAALRTALTAIGAAKSDRPELELQGQQPTPKAAPKPTTPAPAPAADDEAPDPLLSQAEAVIKKHGRASISLVQRELQIGYNRAARLLEALGHSAAPATTPADTASPTTAPWNPLDDMLAFDVLPPGRCDDGMVERCRLRAIHRTAAALATHRACIEIRDRGPQLNALLPAAMADALCMSLWAGFDFEEQGSESLADLARLAGISSHPPSRTPGDPWPDHTTRVAEWITSLDRTDATCLAYAMVAQDHQQLPTGPAWHHVATSTGIAPGPVQAEAINAVNERLRLELITRQSTPASAPSTAGKKVPVKYRNTDTGETWSGRGLQPKWLKAALAEGKALADFAVGGAE